MFKPLPSGTTGRITVTAQHYSRVLYVDEGLRSLVASILGPGDWTYLYLVHTVNIEVVRVDSVSAEALHVTRARDGTQRMLLPPTTTIYYDTTIAGIEDTVREQLGAIALTGTGVAQVDGSNVYVPRITISGDGAELDITDSSVLWDRKQDKCEPYVCPGYVIGPYYVTSQIYPINVIEVFTTYAALLEGYMSGVDALEVFDSYAELISGALVVTVGYRTYDKVLEEFDSSAELVSGDLIVTVGYRTYSEWSTEDNSEKLDSSAELISGSLPVVTAYITYTMQPDSITTGGEFVSGALG